MLRSPADPSSRWGCDRDTVDGGLQTSGGPAWQRRVLLPPPPLRRGGSSVGQRSACGPRRVQRVCGPPPVPSHVRQRPFHVGSGEPYCGQQADSGAPHRASRCDSVGRSFTFRHKAKACVPGPAGGGPGLQRSVGRTSAAPGGPGGATLRMGRGPRRSRTACPQTHRDPEGRVLRAERGADQAG